jgi:FlaA1/EpsC-like NDP-sugar epimerase
VALLIGSQRLPRSVPPLATACTATGAVALRSTWRLLRQKRRRPSGGDRVLVLGAGDASYQIVGALLSEPNSSYEPVALLDDDPHKRNLRFHGLRVEGTIDDLGAVAARTRCTSALLAIPSADSELIRHVAATANRVGIKLLVLPRTVETFGKVTLSDIRPVSAEDMLGRHPTDIDTRAVAHYVTGRRVLVTGAGGSIGSELCRQLQAFEPTALLMLDRDESGLHATQLSIDGRGLLDDPNLVLADIRDRERLFELFDRLRPDVVFHAAALKHLSLLESNPDEAWKTNVLGTRNVLEAAAAAGASQVINISTDKAASPISVLGHSKRIAERLTAFQGTRDPGTYVSVRFGNVLGSRGSVLIAFAAQAAAGGPITVTDPDATRYFMTVAEAVRLTIYAGAVGRSGEALVLEMGKPVRILDVARRFAESASPPLEIEFTGLRPGEKKHEVLFSDDEQGAQPVHALISHVAVPPLNIEGSSQGPVTAEQLRALSTDPGRFVMA